MEGHSKHSWTLPKSVEMTLERIERAKRRKQMGVVSACLMATCLVAILMFFLVCFRGNGSDSDSTTFKHSSSRFLSSLRRLRGHENLSNHVIQIQELSNDFPSLQDSIEMARLSGLVYRFKHYDDCNATDTHGIPLLPSDLQCHLYHHDQKQGTQVMILSSPTQRYIAIVFAGTDDLRTTLTDTNILMKPFGPLDQNGESILLPGPARVHAGFDNAVFENDLLWDQLLNITTRLLQNEPNHTRLFTTGHSLGGANAILTAVALTQSNLPRLKNITCINFGCPNVGNEHWRDAVHNLHSSSTKCAIWRFVHGWDVVPRLPEYPFAHVGHTLQMNADGMHAYYLHRGNVSMNYASVPLGWSAKPFIFLPGALWSHEIRKYQEYLENISAVYPSQYYVHEFEAINTTNATDDDDGMMNDDAYINPPDDDVLAEEKDTVVVVEEDLQHKVVMAEENIIVNVQ